MRLVFFAARKLQRSYFQRLADCISSGCKSEGAKLIEASPIEARVLWHKSLWRTPRWLLQLTKQDSDDRQKLKEIVADHATEKKNSRKGRQRKASYWPKFKSLKQQEAHLLLAIYKHGLQASRADVVVIWNGLKFRQRILVAAAESLGMKCLYMENGLLPGMTTLDAKGINFYNSVPREREFFDAQPAPSDDVMAQLSSGLRGQFSDRPSHLPDAYIFVPFQVNTDSQVVLFSPWLKDMYQLVAAFSAAAEALGSDMPHVVFKLHPACDQNYDELIARYQSHRHIHFDCNTPTPVLIQHADAVSTINSTVGIESLLLGKKVLLLGQAFYQLAGMTLSANDSAALQKRLPELACWQPDEVLTSRFFGYLSQHYQLPGRWQTPSAEHVTVTAQRIIELVQETQRQEVKQ